MAIHLRTGPARYFAASGALGWDGYDAGHGLARLWKLPFRWAGLVDPRDFAVVAKTVTWARRRGNLKWWCPWRCVRLIPGGAVNAVELTNPGMEEWIVRHYTAHVRRDCPFPLVASVMPADTIEAELMARHIHLRCPRLAGVEVNVSCPNVAHEGPGPASLVRPFIRETDLPVLAKLGWGSHTLDICRELDDARLAAFHLVNTTPWSEVFPGKPSPLARYGLEGGVSGEPLRNISRQALSDYKAAGFRTPVISGGGILTAEEAFGRFAMGADAVAFGVAFLRTPWRMRGLVRELGLTGHPDEQRLDVTMPTT